MIAEFDATTGGGLNASIRCYPSHDDFFDAALLELEVEIGIRESVLAPMLLDHDVTRLRGEFGIPVTAPGSIGKVRGSIACDLRRVWISPAVVISLTPPPMRHVKKDNPKPSCRGNERAKMSDQIDRVSDWPDFRPKLAAFAEQIVAGVD